jgi:hypothetical protein
MITNFNIVDKGTAGYNNASTFVSTNQWELGWQGPVSVDSVEISVTDTRVLDVNENLVWAGLLHWDLLVDDSYGKLTSLRKWHYGIKVALTSSSLLDNLGPLLSWDLWRHYKVFEVDFGFRILDFGSKLRLLFCRLIRDVEIIFMGSIDRLLE